MKKILGFLGMAVLIATMIVCNGCVGNTDLSMAVNILDISKLKKYAEKGNADAQTELGERYYVGIYGVREDTAEALKWYRKTFEQGNAYAKYRLGKCYDEGIGVEDNYTKANSLYKEALAEFEKMAEAGNAKAQLYVGFCYEKGRGTEKNLKAAFEAYKKSAETGYFLGQYELGYCYYWGGVRRSIIYRSREMVQTCGGTEIC